MGVASQFVKDAAQQSSKPGMIAGRGAQTSNVEQAANSQHSATDVWTRTWEGMKSNTGKGDAQPALGAAPAFGVATPFLTKNMGQLMTAVGPRTAAMFGKAVGGSVGMLAATAEAAASAKGVWNGVVNQEWHSSEFSAGAEQQAGAVWDNITNLFHGGDKPPPKGVLGHFGAAVSVLTSAEQLLTSALTSWIPAPALPAVRVLDLEVGLPHVHNHPPNIPGPGALPSTGPVIPIPYVSGAATVLINGMPAARCGDMGVGIWCGGYFPLFEIFLGSSTVWLEGARAARVGTDITKHCIFTNPKAFLKGADNPLGVPIGFPVGSSPNVLIGGVPLPSLTAMALGGIFKGIFRGLGALCSALRKVKAFSRAFQLSDKAKGTVKQLAGDIRHAPDMLRMRKPGQGAIDLLKDYIKARRMVDQLLKDKTIQILDRGDPVFRAWAEKDLRIIASSRKGREVLMDISRTPHGVTIEPLHSPHVSAAEQAYGPHALGGPGFDQPGVGSPTKIRLDPNDPFITKDMPTDRTAMHELGHARNNALGQNARSQPTPSTFDKSVWSNMEEYKNIRDVDNPYGAEWGHAPRNGHNHIPGIPQPPPAAATPPAATPPVTPPAATPPTPGPGGTLPGVGPAGPGPGAPAPGPGGTLPGVGPTPPTPPGGSP